MKKPNRKDFPNNRNGSSKYNAAVRKYNTFVKNKNKPVNKDPRPKIGDFPNREAYRQQVLKWNERRKARIETERNKDSRLTSRGRKPIKTKTDLKVNKDKSGSGLSNIPAEEGSNKKFNPNFGKKPVIKKDKPNVGPVTDGKKYADSLGNKKKYKQVSQKELDAKLAEKKKPEVKKTNPLDKYRRTKGEGIEKKTKDQRGDTRITKGLKKAGFTETRLAKLRAKNAAFQKAKKRWKESNGSIQREIPKKGVAKWQKTLV